MQRWAIHGMPHVAGGRSSGTCESSHNRGGAGGIPLGLRWARRVEFLYALKRFNVSAIQVQGDELQQDLANAAKAAGRD